LPLVAISIFSRYLLNIRTFGLGTFYFVLPRWNSSLPGLN
jgi:hypothetical protein